MKDFITWIEKAYDIQAIPVRVKNEKRFESMDEIIPRMQPLEGVAQNVEFGDGYGVVLYSFTLLSDDIKNEIIKKYQEQV